MYTIKYSMVCTVYVACQYEDDRNSNWNQILYSCLREEQAELRGKGYRILIIGDMNGHIGCDNVGIAGNKPGINPTATLLRPSLPEYFHNL